MTYLHMFQCRCRRGIQGSMNALLFISAQLCSQVPAASSTRLQVCTLRETNKGNLVQHFSVKVVSSVVQLYIASIWLGEKLPEKIRVHDCDVMIFSGNIPEAGLVRGLWVVLTAQLNCPIVCRSCEQSESLRTKEVMMHTSSTFYKNI